MQQRPSSRLLVINADKRILLFKFEHKRGPLAGQVFWATPGGGLEADETYEVAACRELFEEVGIALAHPGPIIAKRLTEFRLPSGEMVEADERYFLVEAKDAAMNPAHWTPLEQEVMTTHHWWSQREMQKATETIWPADLAAMLIEAGIWQGDAPK